MDCQPIPPNSEFFLSYAQFQEKIPAAFWPKMEADSIFFMVEVTRILDIKHDYIPWNWRIAIAAVARCAWFDEGIKKDGWTLERFKECTDNFEAWRLWGLMK